MSEYRRLAEKFFERYESPIVEEYIQGFSGIAPQKKVFASDLDHEQLDGLMGGEVGGHYHLTQEQYEWLVGQMGGNNFKPVIADGQVINVFRGAEMAPYEIQGTNLR